MLIYTGQAYGKKLEKLKTLKLGMMISTCNGFAPSKEFKAVPTALDNGAFACWQKGYPFQGQLFRERIIDCYNVGLEMQFIVCPDIVARGDISLDYSLSWAKGELITAPRLALAVQDGMKPKDLCGNYLKHFTHLFVGGSVEWKWETAKEWVEFAHSKDMQCHIGRVGRLEQLKMAYEYGADSVDSTNFARNESWDIIEQFAAFVNGTAPSICDLIDESSANPLAG